jgi:hypothetical protein
LKPDRHIRHGDTPPNYYSIRARRQKPIARQIELALLMDVQLDAKFASGQQKA